MDSNQEDIVTKYRIHQCGIVVKDRAKALEEIRNLLGVSPDRTLNASNQYNVRFHGENIHCEAILDFIQVGPLEIELIEPGRGDSTWSEFLHTAGEGIHHLGMMVTDLKAELDRFAKLGIKQIQSGESDHVKYAYLDTKKKIGVILELLEEK